MSTLTKLTFPENNNFNEQDKKILLKHNIQTVEDVVRSDFITKNDKLRFIKCIKCYKFVKDRYKICDVEPINGNNPITLDGALFVLKINHQGFVKFIQRMSGKMDDYMILGMK
eukprot:228807_1